MSSVAFAYNKYIVRCVAVKFSFSRIVDAFDVFFAILVKDQLTDTRLTNDIRYQAFGAIVQCLCFQIIPSKETEPPNSCTTVGKEQDILVTRNLSLPT